VEEMDLKEKSKRLLELISAVEISLAKANTYQFKLKYAKLLVEMYEGIIDYNKNDET
jgi:hypothetical protein